MTTVRVKLPFASRAEMRAKHARELAACGFVLRTSSPREKGTQFRLELRLKDDSPCFAALVAVEEVETIAGGGARMRLRILEGDEAAIDLIDELGGRSPPRLRPPAVPLPKPGPPAQAKPSPSTPPPPIADPFEDMDLGMEDDAGAEALRTGAISVLTPVPARSTEDEVPEPDLSSDESSSEEPVDPFASEVPAGDPAVAKGAPAISLGTEAAANDPFAEQGEVDPFAGGEPAADPFAGPDTAIDPFADPSSAGAAPPSESPSSAQTQAPPKSPGAKPQPLGRLQPAPKPQPPSGPQAAPPPRPAAAPQTGAKPQPGSTPQGGVKPAPTAKPPPAPHPPPRSAPPRTPTPAPQAKLPPQPRTPTPAPQAKLPPQPRPQSKPPPQPPPSTRPAPPPMPPPVIDPGAAGKPKVAAQPLEARSVPTDMKPVIKTPAGKGAIIGIDLGTTNSCAAVVKHKKPFIIPSREGYNTIPSVVALTDKGRLIVGHPAKSQMLINPRATVYGSKRLVGRQFNSPVVADLLGRFAYEIVAGERGEAAVRLGDDVLSLQQIAALIIGEVKDIAQQWLGTQVTRAVITVPAYYNDNQRQAVRAAGALAGLNVERILNEPTAAAIAFAHGREMEKRILVYDLGGGTFDASVLELHGSVYEVVSTGGDTFLGGVDFDKAIVQHLLDQFKQQHGIEFPGDRVALQRIGDAAERAKIGLSEGAVANINVPFVALVGEKPYDLKATIVRDELDRLTATLVDRTLRVCDDVLTARGLGPSDIADVILVGGMSRMPLVRQKIKEYFGKEPTKSVHPDEAVALGAAMLAESIDSGDISGMTLIDVLPMSIGVGLPGGRFKKIIERNTSLPYKRGYSLWTSRDDQTTLEIPIFQGESERADKNEYLGTLVVPDLPRGARGTVVFDIQFVLSAESILTVTAEQRGTARMVSATFSTQETPDGVRRRLQENPNGLDSADVERGSAAKDGFFKKLFGGRAKSA